MGKCCDYFVEKDKKEYCALKKDQISYEQYKEYCRADDMKKCPIYQFWKDNR